MSIENMYPSMAPKASTEKHAEPALASEMFPSMKKPEPMKPTAADIYPSMKKAEPAKPIAAKADDKPVQSKPADRSEPKSDDKPDDKPAAKTAEQIEASAAKLSEELALDAGDVRASPFAKVAAELGLDKAGAEKLTKLDLETRTAYWQDAAKKWETASLAEFSADEIQSARQFVGAFGDAELSDLLNKFGLGSHPAVIRAMAKAGKSLKR